MIALEFPVRPRQGTAALLTALLVSAACGGLGTRPHAPQARPARQDPRAELAERVLPEGEVRLWLTIEFDSCGAYLMTDREDQERVLRSLHGKIINDVGFLNLQKLGPYKATNDLLEGGFPAEGMTILAKRGLEAISGTAAYKPTPACPPGASCRVSEGRHIVTGKFSVMRNNELWTIQEKSKLGLVTTPVMLHVEVVTRIAH
jgi:hypothetical protein